jgi:hypothetical protein
VWVRRATTLDRIGCGDVRRSTGDKDDRLATSRGILIGLVLSGAIWIGAVAAVVF